MTGPDEHRAIAGDHGSPDKPASRISLPAGGCRPSPIPALFAAAVVLVCLALGVWQLQRLEWKSRLIAEREAASQSAPVPLPRTLEDAGALEFRPVAVEGVLLHDKEIFLGAASPAGGRPGFHVLTPLRETGGAAGDRILFVNRGFVPASLKDPEQRGAGQLPGTVRVAGLLRLPKGKPGWVVPENRPDINYWFWVDPPAMAAAAGLSAADIAPFYIDADATANPGGWPRGGVTPIRLPNDHLQYAITWFLLAAAAVAVYAAWRRQAARRR